LFNPSGETRLHIALQPFVGFDVSGGIEPIAHVLSHYLRELETDQLPAFGRDPDRRELRIGPVCHRRGQKENRKRHEFAQSAM
jgi:hypothetical protein